VIDGLLGRLLVVASGQLLLNVTEKVPSTVPPGWSLTRAVTVPAESGVQVSHRLVKEPVVAVWVVQLGMRSCNVSGRPDPATVNAVGVPTLAFRGDRDVTTMPPAPLTVTVLVTGSLTAPRISTVVQLMVLLPRADHAKPVVNVVPPLAGLVSYGI
jgi:hypothetical protein